MDNPRLENEQEIRRITDPSWLWTTEEITKHEMTSIMKYIGTKYMHETQRHVTSTDCLAYKTNKPHRRIPSNKKPSYGQAMPVMPDPFGWTKKKAMGILDRTVYGRSPSASPCGLVANSPLLLSWGEVSAEEEEYNRNIHLTPLEDPRSPRLASRDFLRRKSGPPRPPVQETGPGGEK